MDATDDSAGLDQPWARTLPARAAREAIICGVFGSIIGTYARREIVGHEHLEHLQGPVIFVANHCSHVDTPALLRSLPTRWRRRTAVAAAADYFYTKRLLSGAVSLAFCTVPLERRGGGMGTDATAHMKRLIETRWSLVVFAEGTRSRDGRVGRLRSGAAVLAAQHRLPIVPIHIAGTHDAMPTGRNWMVRPEGGGRWARHTIPVSFGAPIHVGPRDDRFEVMERVRLFMEACGADTTQDPKLVARRAAAAKAARTASVAGAGSV
ncbi:MAG: phospholipid/glycerol acyltransferase [Solirubrobacterales bacterium]|jgi:1-acyl-sn-glycerol-3-phosphate acyltransferase|nr:phospholipid/glycerol acyltransferase [Solirubrobacterales bacterium]